MSKCVLLLCFICATTFSETVTQADWSGGDGVSGPVIDWENKYYSSYLVYTFDGVLELYRTLLSNPIEHTVTTDFIGAYSVCASDIDGDSDVDVVGAAFSSDRISWWENVDGYGLEWNETTVDSSFDYPTSVFSSDIDNDGDADVLGAAFSDDEISWWENVSGSGTIWEKHEVDISFGGAHSVFAADVNGDDNMDVLGAAFNANTISWWENSGGLGPIWTEHTVDVEFGGASSVYAADIDGDGDMDVLGAADYDEKIAWWENKDGSGLIWTEHTVDTAASGARSVCAADIDGDGDLDILCATSWSFTLSWWENVWGDGSAWDKHQIDNLYIGAFAVSAADINDDGSVDVLGVSDYSDNITWWENVNETGTIWYKRSIDSDFDGALSVCAADIDSDGALDVLGAASGADAISWWSVIGNVEAGSLTSSILNAGFVDEWETFFYNSEEPTGTSVGFQFRSSKDYTDMGDWSDTLFSAGTTLDGILEDSTPYLQYRTVLLNTNYISTPVVEEVTFSYILQLGIGDTEVGSWTLNLSSNPSWGKLSAIITVPEPETVYLHLYDVSGRVVAESTHDFLVGSYSVNFIGLSQGVYFCVMRAGDFFTSVKVVILN